MVPDLATGCTSVRRMMSKSFESLGHFKNAFPDSAVWTLMQFRSYMHYTTFCHGLNVDPNDLTEDINGHTYYRWCTHYAPAEDCDDIVFYEERDDCHVYFYRGMLYNNQQMLMLLRPSPVSQVGVTRVFSAEDYVPMVKGITNAVFSSEDYGKEASRILVFTITATISELDMQIGMQDLECKMS
ncbi:hypothetical protein DFJ58DRAFT_837334 [Suillus subalutaceus]|uniref:uncharacterized protein n=1 Tax=Suillus subalutaceus TaxID=48586 RepID=UPI001B872450|nr:uncharacterized protein DFJ58DRAFT_837334 [Suillus subalutaceus]KAG1870582.1 hypothetical protein DFJ58DRAFT_837334 [Suillus subalutaceus]